MRTYTDRHLMAKESLVQLVGLSVRFSHNSNHHILYQNSHTSIDHPRREFSLHYGTFL